MRPTASRSLVAPLVSGVLLYVFAAGFAVFAGAVVPYLLELMEKSMRLAAVGWLALLASPVGFLALAHRAAHGVIDWFDVAGEKRSRRFESTRAGMFGCFAMWFSSMASGFLLLAIFPPPPEEGGVAALLRVATDVRLEMGVHALLWIAVAAALFHVDSAAKG